MRISSTCLLVSAAVLTLLGCNDSDGVPSDLGTGGSVGQGGASLGGAAPNAGGSTSATGGQSVGGATSQVGGSNATGGSISSGGSIGTGGTPSTGGSTTSTGGRAAGGAVAPGGKAAGGAATGGVNAAGGATTTVDKFVGNITTNNAVNSGSLVYSKYWDQITPENAGKWGSVQSSPTSSFNWGSLDTVYSYAQTNNIIFKQHTFVWGAQQPSGTPTLAQVENWIKSFCTRFPNTKLIDVVNEPPPHTTPSYTANLGAGETGSYPWITKAFKLARQHCGSAILILNDYNNIEWSSNQTTFNNIVKDIKAAGAPIDAVGAQAHDLDHASITFSMVQSLLASLNSQTGLPVYITELDLDYSDDTAQLNAYKQYMPLFMDASYVKGITIWGWIFGSTWSQAPNSGLVRNGASRPAMTYLMGLRGRTAP